MVDFIDDLELSVRARNVLRNMGVTTEADFMALTRTQVLAQKNAGARTWREVAEVQQGLREVQLQRNAPQSVQWSRRDDLAMAAMQALIATRTTEDNDRILKKFDYDVEAAAQGVADVTAKWAFMFADAFMAARETKER